MSIKLQIRRGSNAENNSFTGAVGELTMDTDKKELRIHDGSTQGGRIIGKTIEKAPRRFIVAQSQTQLKIKAGVVLLLGTTVYQTNSDYVFSPASNLDSGSTLTAGKDYYVYIATNDNSTIDVVCSLSASAPSGYTTYKRIGGFHTLCVSVGTISGHTLSGFVAGNILPESVWCLNHHALCLSKNNNAGMVYEEVNNGWCDIYNIGTSGQSAYGASRANNLQHYQFSELLRANGKRLLTDGEFYCASKGSNQKTAVKGASQPSPDTTGGHQDTANRRMISNIGCEEMCGLQYQHLEPTCAAGGSSWKTQAGDEGSFYGSAMVLRAGGSWENSSNCGSRCRDADSSLSSEASRIGARGWSPNVENMD